MNQAFEYFGVGGGEAKLDLDERFGAAVLGAVVDHLKHAPAFGSGAGLPSHGEFGGVGFDGSKGDDGVRQFDAGRELAELIVHGGVDVHGHQLCRCLGCGAVG